MPAVLRKNIGGATLVVWRITETEAELARMIPVEDILSAERFASPKRRVQHMAARAAVREVVPEGEIKYTPAGAPYTTDTAGNIVHIGVSHTDGMAAVIVSASRCAVDIEHTGRDFGAARDRFITQAEREFADSDLPEFAAAVWCAKETLYKYSGRRELDFLKDLRITRSDIAGLCMEGCVDDSEGIVIRILRFGEHIITYIA